MKTIQWVEKSEKISDYYEEILVGGFSNTYSYATGSLVGAEVANNCGHGNCTSLCGANTYCSGNAFAGCGIS